MKPIWSRKEVTCAYCGNIVPKHTKRIDEITSINGHLIRTHRHVECLIAEINEWFNRNPITVPVRIGRGRILDLPPDEAGSRKRVLSRLSALRQYYLPKLNLQGNIESLSVLDLKRFRRFNESYKSLVSELKELGGIPDRYALSPDDTRPLVESKFPL